MRSLLCTLALVFIVGCRTQSTAMTNPFLAPDRVPPPATRTLLPGTAQPYYPGDPVPNSPVINAPPAGYTPGVQPTPSTYAPQPAGTVPPGGWNGAQQGSLPSYDVVPGSVPYAPVTPTTQVQIQPDQQNLRFAQSAPPFQPAVVPSQSVAMLPPDPSVLPTPTIAASPYPNRVVTYEAPLPQQQIIQQSVPVGEPRQVRIRAISSENLDDQGSPTNGRPSISRDGFRPQGSSQVRKPAIASQLVPRKRESVGNDADRFGHDPQYGWLRGRLQYSSETGQWELRYVPEQRQKTEGSADAFGGNLAIANPQVLGGLQPGDFVQLRGRVDDGLTVAAYNVSVVQRQRI